MDTGLFYCIGINEGIKYAWYSSRAEGDDCWQIGRFEYIVLISKYVTEYPNLLEPSAVH